jgi:phage terminase small subunit
MSNLSVEILLKEVDNLTKAEKIELVEYLTKEIEKQPIKTKSKNLVELFQNSPLVGVDIDLERQRDIDNREVEL